MTLKITIVKAMIFLMEIYEGAREMYFMKNKEEKAFELRNEDNYKEYQRLQEEEFINLESNKNCLLFQDDNHKQKCMYFRQNT